MVIVVLFFGVFWELIFDGEEVENVLGEARLF